MWGDLDSGISTIPNTIGNSTSLLYVTAKHIEYFLLDEPWFLEDCCTVGVLKDTNVPDIRELGYYLLCMVYGGSEIDETTAMHNTQTWTCKNLKSEVLKEPRRLVFIGDISEGHL